MAKYNAHGTLLKMGDALVSPTYTTIAQVESIDGPGGTRGTEGVPTHDDTGGIDKIADALYDGGQLSVTVLYDPSLGTHDASTGFHSVFQSGAKRPFQLIFPSSLGQFDFDAFITAFSPQGMQANTGKLRASLTIDISGDVTES